MDGRSWGRVIPALSQDRRLVVIDGPGHGASGDPGRRYSLRDCVTAAGEVLARLAVGDPVDWVGNAWGGHVGLRFAADPPGSAAPWSCSERPWRHCPAVNDSGRIRS